MSDEAVVNLPIPTDISLIYELDDSLTPIRYLYLGDPPVGQRAPETITGPLI